jgi:hypothetical protein
MKKSYITFTKFAFVYTTTPVPPIDSELFNIISIATSRQNDDQSIKACDSHNSFFYFWVITSPIHHRNTKINLSVSVNLDWENHVFDRKDLELPLHFPLRPSTFSYAQHLDYPSICWTKKLVFHSTMIFSRMFLIAITWNEIAGSGNHQFFLHSSFEWSMNPNSNT